MTNQTTNDEKLTFEQAMTSLEEIINQLEAGDVPLEKAIDMYQQGMTLSKQCHEQLQHVEKKMDQIVNEDGEVEAFQMSEEDRT
ncbi:MULTISPECIES: exodeoxyribonuclease VII small subunit [Geomicrobium]|uniref:Exodeoxyribonuclease 7 small subunit n=1 Tax=Geomicrobium sediminis TaxID=1347788 RepID=A0ABS2PE11_9BACL|nr:exodeoxyribonuclease VII small subunit [Geomicrobium sp. JCM 19038]MBM7633645.1 exodeoxyribonuclease VII small subunit [Geomicrobium sediminis]GAK06543.1 exodeoxyribonuclease VII small subunit [Geomicrobium sp. JCM 19038]